MINCELKLEQEFRLRQFEQQVQEMSREDLEATFLGLARLAMVKDNIIAQLVKGELPDLGFGVPEGLK